MEKLIAYRTHSSPYQGADFSGREELALKKLKVEYTHEQKLANVLITNTHTNIGQFDLSTIKLIIHPNSGYDNFSASQVAASPCPIILGNPVRAMAVTNYILSCLFSYYSFPPKHQTWDKQRIWPRLLSDQLHVQLIGFGHIGKNLQQALSPVVKKLSIYDPYQNHFDLKWEQADVIIFACGLNSSSKKMLNQEQFKKLKENVLIINPARGELIEQPALWDFLSTHPQSFAYLDVFEKEPAPLEQWPLSNTHFSSHIAGVSSDLEQRIIDFEVSVLRDYIEMPTEQFVRSYQNLLLHKRLLADELI